MTTQINLTTLSKELKEVCHKILQSERISFSEGIYLYQNAPLGLMAFLANEIRLKKNEKYTCFIRNIHIEPTNICKHECLFCSYNHRYAGYGWELSLDEIFDKINNEAGQAAEVHITGGVHPERDIVYYASMLRGIKKLRPDIHIKAFSAVELDDMITKSGKTLSEGLQYLKDSGLGSIPGGGAEIFDSELRRKICGDKSSAERYLEIHAAAHQAGLPSNATMLYGHFESITHRVQHLELLRQAQDKTKGFMAFIPLKFKNKNNKLSNLAESSLMDDLRLFAFSRIYLDNFQHIKAYWPMLGKTFTQLTLHFGVDDLDGTIEDSTRIYSMAGSEEQNPAMSVQDFITFVKEAGLIPVERDSFYHKSKIYDD